MKLPLLQKACLYRLTLVTVTDEYGEMCGIGWSYKGRAMEEINRYISIDKHKKAQLHLRAHSRLLAFGLLPVL